MALVAFSHARAAAASSLAVGTQPAWRHWIRGGGAVLMGRAAGGKHGRRRAAAAERGNGCGNAALVAVVYGEVPWAAAASAGAGEHGQGRRQAPKRRRPEEGEAAEAEAAEETVKTSRRCRALTYYGSVVGALMSCTQAWCFVQGWAL